jgi:hypothetical protein
MPQDLVHSKLGRENATSPCSCGPDYFDFTSVAIAGRFTLYWTTIVVANRILTLQGENDSSLVKESHSAADNICKSIPYYRRLKPLGTESIKVPLSAAFSISSTGKRQQIVEALQELFEPRSDDSWCTQMQLTFDVLTGTYSPGTS